MALDTTGWLPIIGWRVWLTDGTALESAANAWEDVPDEVQVLCFYHERPYRTFVYGRDEYEVPESDVKKLGQWMQPDDFYALVKVAEGSAEWVG